jgi:hypothetical protein
LSLWPCYTSCWCICIAFHHLITTYETGTSFDNHIPVIQNLNTSKGSCVFLVPLVLRKNDLRVCLVC